MDEAGRGPLAGPVVACACILPQNLAIDGVNDSKKLTPLKRAAIYKILTENPEIAYAVSIVDADEIDKINILQATFKAMQLAVFLLKTRPDYILVDGNKHPDFSIPAEAIVKGDSLSQSIACASIIAKETRDAIMLRYHLQWPEFGFDRHKGYGTEEHLRALALHGPRPIHRKTFEPVNKVCNVPVPLPVPLPDPN